MTISTLWRFRIGPLVILSLAACSNTLPLHYVGTEQQSAAAATVSALDVVDQRGEPDPTWYGAIRGGYGNPLKTLHSDKPINVTVRDAFEAALAARGIRLDLNANGPSVSVTVADFEADRIVRSEVKIRLGVVVDSSTGRQVYQHETFRDPVELAGLAEGILADPKDLQAMTQTTLVRVIDEAVDAPGFQAAIRQQ
jgi:uncharacterized lipoprotein YajG